jgi:hypothetical protein
LGRVRRLVALRAQPRRLPAERLATEGFGLTFLVVGLILEDRYET